MCVSVHVYMCVCMCVFLYVCMQLCVFVCMSVCVHACVCVCECAHLQMCTCVCVCECVCVHECACVCMQMSVFVYLWCLPPRVTEQHDVPQEDKDKAAHTECGFRLSQLWKSHLRGSPIKSSPILYDVDRDGYSDILVASTTGELWAVHGESGHVIDNWPLLLEGRSFHGSPLLVSMG